MFREEKSIRLPEEVSRCVVINWWGNLLYLDENKNSKEEESGPKIKGRLNKIIQGLDHNKFKIFDTSNKKVVF